MDLMFIKVLNLSISASWLVLAVLLGLCPVVSAVVAVILGCGIAAWRRGFIRAVLGFLPMAAALVGTHLVSPYVGKFLRGKVLLKPEKWGAFTED